MLSMWKLLSTLHSEVDQILGVPWCCCPICIFLHLHCKKCSKIKRDTLQNVVVFFFFWQNKKKHHSDYIWEDICLSSGIKKWFGSTKWSSNKPSEMDGAPRCYKWDGLDLIFFFYQYLFRNLYIFWTSLLIDVYIWIEYLRVLVGKEHLTVLSTRFPFFFFSWLFFLLSLFSVVFSSNPPLNSSFPLLSLSFHYKCSSSRSPRGPTRRGKFANKDYHDDHHQCYQISWWNGIVLVSTVKHQISGRF